MGNIIRICTLCDEQYEQGTYRAHAQVHSPVRRRPATVQAKVDPSIVRALVAEGRSHTDVAREVGLTRQRVSQIVKEGEAA